MVHAETKISNASENKNKFEFQRYCWTFRFRHWELFMLLHSCISYSWHSPVLCKNPSWIQRKKGWKLLPILFFSSLMIKKKAWSSFPFNWSSACAPSLSPIPMKHSVARHADCFSCPSRASSKGQMQRQPPAKIHWFTGDLDLGPISETLHTPGSKKFYKEG